MRTASSHGVVHCWLSGLSLCRSLSGDQTPIVLLMDHPSDTTFGCSGGKRGVCNSCLDCGATVRMCTCCSCSPRLLCSALNRTESQLPGPAPHARTHKQRQVYGYFLFSLSPLCLIPGEVYCRLCVHAQYVLHRRHIGAHVYCVHYVIITQGHQSSRWATYWQQVAFDKVKLCRLPCFYWQRPKKFIYCGTGSLYITNLHVCHAVEEGITAKSLL